jgi:hypothetical protein
MIYRIYIILETLFYHVLSHRLQCTHYMVTFSFVSIILNIASYEPSVSKNQAHSNSIEIRGFQ